MLVATAVFGTGVLGQLAPRPAAAAAAETSGEAQAAATDLLRQVDQLQSAAAQATTDYRNALTGVASAVTAHLRAEAALVTITRATADRRENLDGRVRSLYKSGGPVTVYASVMSAHTITEALDLANVANRVVAADRRVVSAGEQAGTVAATLAADAAGTATAQIQVERRAGEAATRLASLLDQQRVVLAAAQAHVVVLQAAEAEAARVAEAARQAALRAAAEAATRLAAQQAAAEALVSSQVSAARPSNPTGYLALYHAAAATCPGLPWTVLAAIGQVETGHGTDTSTSNAGAMGPMQFLPSTWAVVAVDGNGDGQRDIQNPADAIFTAAKYLCQNGGGSPASLSGAIWNYNHADWYVALVLALAAQYT